MCSLIINQQTPTVKKEVNQSINSLNQNDKLLEDT